MNQPIRRPARVRSAAAVAALGLAVAGWAVAAVGCDKKASTDAPAGTTPPAQAPAAAGKPTVGVIDFEQVMKDLGWTRDRDTRLGALNAELQRQRDSFLTQLNAIITQRKESLFKDANFSKDDITKFNEGKDIEKLPWTNQQRDQYVLFAQQMNQLFKAAEQRHRELLQLWAQEANKTYLMLMQPGIRRAAEASGVTVVIPSGNVVYTADSVNITNKVVDDLKAVKPDNFPAFPKFDMEIRMNEATTQPTTGPATPATPGGSGKPTTKSK